MALSDSDDASSRNLVYSSPSSRSGVLEHGLGNAESVASVLSGLGGQQARRHTAAVNKTLLPSTEQQQQQQSRPAQSSCLLRLPTELLERIATFVWQPTSESVTEYREASHTFIAKLVLTLEAKDSLGLRLVCRDLTSATYRAFAQQFFSDLTVIITHASLQRFIDVAQHPHLSKYTKKLTIGHYRIPEVADLSESACPSFRNNLIYKCLVEGPHEDSTLPWHTGVLGEARVYAANYRTALKAQHDLEDCNDDESMLAIGIELLGSKLKAIEIANTRPRPESWLGKIKHWGADTLLDHAGIIDRIFCQYPNDCGERVTTNTSFVARKLINALVQIVARKPLFVLDSLRIEGPSGCGENSPQAFQLHKLALLTYDIGTEIHLKHLELYITPWHRGNIATLVSATLSGRMHLLSLLSDDLEELILGFADDFSEGWDTDAWSLGEGLWDRVASRKRMRRLHTIKICGEAYIKLEDLTRFVQTHHDTLVNVYVNFKEREETPRSLDALFRALSLCELLQNLDFEMMDRDDYFLEARGSGKEEVKETIQFLLDSGDARGALVSRFTSDGSSATEQIAIQEVHGE